MGKKIKITLLLLGIILVLGFGGVYIVYDKSTDYVIASVFESLLREDLAAEGMLGTDGELTEEAKKQMAKTNMSKQEQVGVEQVADDANDTSVVAADIKNESDAENASGGEAETTQEAQSAKDPAATKQDKTLTTKDKKPAASKKNTSQKQVSIQERVEEIVKGIPVRDKNAVMRLIVQNVSSNDIRYLSSLATDGNISGADIAKAKEVAYKSFTPEQMKQVKYYYSKYIGLFAEFY